MLGLFLRTLARIVESGNLTVIDDRGGRHRFGDGTGPLVTIRIADRGVYRELVLDPYLHLGEVYMDRRLTIEDGTIYDFLMLVGANLARLPAPPAILHGLSAFRYLTRRFRQFNPLSRARRNVAHHYDLDAQLYDLFLDSDRQYSCAYFKSPSDTLDQAQLQKKRHLAAKLDIRDGQKILDIGSGWGGLGIYLAECADVEVVGVTLSEEQLAYANARKAELGLDRRVDFRLQDYRTLDERFDRIVSVGMFEHVGIGHYRRFFNSVRNLLASDGVAMLHSIGRFDGPGYTNPWIAKYIFPGGYIPALSEVLPIVEKSGLFATDIEILRLHYAETLKEWRHRFVRAWDEAEAIYDERFCRMWEFYLAASEVSFRHQGMMVFQLQMSASQETLPLTRDYMPDAEDDLARIGQPAAGRQLAGE